MYGIDTSSESVRDQEMEAEARIMEHDDQYWDEGRCRACLNERMLDDDRICENCDPVERDTRVALLDLLATYKPKGSAQENA